MTPEVVVFPNGRWRQNCYVVNSGSRDALLIDPGSDVEAIKALIEARGYGPVAILLTHGHYDHIGAVAPLVQSYGVPVYMHGDDLVLLKRANLYRLVFEAREAIRIPEVTHDLCSLPPVLELGPFQVSWMPTPGHTPGSVCFRIGNQVFTGDTLLTRRLARMDLPGSDREALRVSLAELARWPESLTNWPGHGPSASLGDSLSLAAELWSRA